MKSKILLAGIAAIFILIFLSGCTNQLSRPHGCPEDAKLCPNGTTVERGGLTCEFAPCPPLILKTSKEIYKAGETIEFELQNNNFRPYYFSDVLLDDIVQPSYISLYKKEGDSFESAFVGFNLENPKNKITALIWELKPSEKLTGSWSKDSQLKKTPGTYKLVLLNNYSTEWETTEEKTFMGQTTQLVDRNLPKLESNEFQIVE